MTKKPKIKDPTTMKVNEFITKEAKEPMNKKAKTFWTEKAKDLEAMKFMTKMAKQFNP